MTTRKLTPAEALECLRDWCNLCMSDFDRKWGERKTGQMVDIAVAALEEALLQKPAAVDLAKSWAGHVQWMAELEARDKALLERIKAIRPTEPAAPVPSDEEIVKQLAWARAAERHSATCTLVEMLARRIGVQGVPK